MTTPIASGVGVGAVPTTTPPTSYSGSSQPRDTENVSPTKTVQSTDTAGSGAATGQAGNSATNAGLSERAANSGIGNSDGNEENTRSGAIAPDVSVGPSPAFVTTVLEAANSEALEPATKETDGIKATEARDTEADTADPEATARPAPEAQTGAQVQANPVAETQSQPLDDPARESFNLARSFAAEHQKPSVDAAA